MNRHDLLSFFYVYPIDASIHFSRANSTKPELLVGWMTWQLEKDIHGCTNAFVLFNNIRVFRKD